MANKAVFEKDVESRKMTITRQFDAPLPLVWDAWTKAEILDQWWAPKPYKAETKSMDFSVDGMWLYAMVGPEGDKQWCRANYKAIDPQQSFSYVDAFCDENGTITTDMPQMSWDNSFIQSGNATTVKVNLTFSKKEDMDEILKMGFEEGFTAGLNNLEQYLAK